MRKLLLTSPISCCAWLLFWLIKWLSTMIIPVRKKLQLLTFLYNFFLSVSSYGSLYMYVGHNDNYSVTGIK